MFKPEVVLTKPLRFPHRNLSQRSPLAVFLMNCVGNEKITRKTLKWKILAVIMEFILSVFSGVP